MSLISEIRSTDKKGLFQSNDNSVAYSTGFPAFDYANGFWSESIDADGNVIYVPTVGIHSGSINSVIGNTGVGKTTVAIQMGWNIVKDFDDGILIIGDCEKTSNRQRIDNITGATRGDERIALLKAKSSIEDILERINTICEAKRLGGDKYKYEVTNGYGGKSFKQYVPTVVIIDSLPSFNSKEYNTDDLGNNIDQMRAAKDITRFFINITDNAWEYNIIFFIINHIRDAAAVNQYAPAPKGVLMLGPGESLPRGKVAQFLTSTFIRVNTKKSALYDEADVGFQGLRCDISLAKSKTNSIGTNIPASFTFNKGFDPDFSLYEFASSAKLVNGRNPYLYIGNLEQYKFRRNEFAMRMKTDDEFKNAIIQELLPHMECMLGDGPSERTTSMSIDDMDDILENEGLDATG